MQRGVSVCVCVCVCVCERERERWLEEGETSEVGGQEDFGCCCWMEAAQG